MKVIMLVNDKKLGKKNSIIEVADSYARNVLIPKKIVEEYTAESENRLNNRISKEKYEYDMKLAKAKKIQEQLIKMGKITVLAKGADDNKMFGSVTNKMIAERLNDLGFEVDKNADFTIDKHNIEICVDKGVIREFGEYEAVVKLFEGIMAKIKVCVVRE